MSDDPAGPHATAPDDDALSADLADLLDRVDPPPAALLDISKSLWTWRTIDSELAVLGQDSLVDEVAGEVRSGDRQRFVTFETDRLTIEVEVTDAAEGRRVIGQLVPGGAAELELRTGTRLISGVADELGRFALALPPERQHASLRCRLPDGSVVETAWLVL
jgi:hypothetical protein